MTPIRTALLILLVAAIAFAIGLQEGKNRPVPTYVLSRPPMIDRPEKLEGVAKEVYQALLVADPLDRAIELATLLKPLGREDMVAVQSAYDSVFVDRHPLDTLIYAHWAAPLDPEGVMEWSRRPLNQAVNAVTAPAILEALAHVDAKKAVGYANSMSFGAYEGLALDGLVRGWDESGQPGLEDYLESLPTGFDRQRRMRVVVRRRIMADGIDGAIEWAKNLQEGGYNFKLDIYRQMVTELAAVDIDRAAEFALANFEGPYGKNLLSRLSYFWANSNGLAATEWCATLPEGEPRDKAVHSAFLTWMRTKKDEPIEWMNAQFASIGEKEWLQPAVPPYLTRLVRNGGLPVDQLEKVRALTRDDIRRKATVAVATGWLRRDEAAASAWLDTSGLPADWISEIRGKSKSPLEKAKAPKGEDA